MSDPVDLARIAEYVRSNVGRPLDADTIAAATGVDRNQILYWLRDRSRNKRSNNREMRPYDGKVHRYGHGLYVYFPNGVPLDWRDRITDWRTAHPGSGVRGRRTAQARTTTYAQASPPSAMMFELIRYNADTQRMILADEDGNVWTGNLTKVEA